MNKFKAIKDLLLKYNKFQECIIEEIRFSNYCTSVEVVFNYIWDETHKIRGDIDKKNFVSLKIDLVTKFSIENDFKKNNSSLSELNWSYNEIALVNIKEMDECFELDILWESNRKISVVSSGQINIMKVWL